MSKSNLKTEQNLYDPNELSTQQSQGSVQTNIAKKFKIGEITTTNTDLNLFKNPM